MYVGQVDGIKKPCVPTCASRTYTIIPVRRTYTVYLYHVPILYTPGLYLITRAVSASRKLGVATTHGPSFRGLATSNSSPAATTDVTYDTLDPSSPLIPVVYLRLRHAAQPSTDSDSCCACLQACADSMAPQSLCTLQLSYLPITSPLMRKTEGLRGLQKGRRDCSSGLPEHEATRRHCSRAT